MAQNPKANHLILTGGNAQHRGFIICCDTITGWWWATRILMSAVTENTDPLIVVTSQCPCLRSRVTAYLYDITVTRHPRTLWWRHVTAANHCKVCNTHLHASRAFVCVTIYQRKIYVPNKFCSMSSHISRTRHVITEFVGLNLAVYGLATGDFHKEATYRWCQRWRQNLQCRANRPVACVRQLSTKTDDALTSWRRWRCLK